LSLGSPRYIITPSYIDELRTIKNSVEIQCLEQAHLRDGAAFVRWMAWLEEKLDQDETPTEFEAVDQLTEYRRALENFVGPAYREISASGANAGTMYDVRHSSLC
jgi:Xaa-Pro aminopeptidase